MFVSGCLFRSVVRINTCLCLPIRGGCTSSSCLMPTLPVGCACCSWPYLSPYVSAGCTVRSELKHEHCNHSDYRFTSVCVFVVQTAAAVHWSSVNMAHTSQQHDFSFLYSLILLFVCPLLEKESNTYSVLEIRI